jgi:hypothetical protein
MLAALQYANFSPGSTKITITMSPLNSNAQQIYPPAFQAERRDQIYLPSRVARISDLPAFKSGKDQIYLLSRVARRSRQTPLPLSTSFEEDLTLQAQPFGMAYYCCQEKKLLPELCLLPDLLLAARIKPAARVITAARIKTAARIITAAICPPNTTRC